MFLRMFVPESPRWLHSQHRYAEMASLLQKIAKWNGVHTEDDDIQLRLQPLVDKDKLEGENGGHYSDSTGASRRPKSQLTRLFVQ